MHNALQSAPGEGKYIAIVGSYFAGSPVKLLGRLLASRPKS